MEYVPRSSDFPDDQIPEYDGTSGIPYLSAPTSASVARKKARYLRTAFVTQRDRHWFTEETFVALMRVRGLESRAAGGYAEAFHLRKAVLGPGLDVGGSTPALTLDDPAIQRMLQPLVSIGMPVFNGERYLEAAIRSNLGQSYEISNSSSRTTPRWIARQRFVRTWPPLRRPR